jgi:hypothetical protein
LLIYARPIVGVVLLVAGATVGASTGSHAATLPACTIQVRDLRPGYQLAGAGYSLVDLAALQYYVSMAPYNGAAALVSYISTFYFPGQPTYRDVEDSISLYPRSGRADQAYRQNVTLVPRWHRVWSYVDHHQRHTLLERWQPLSAPIVGNESAAWETVTHDSHHTYTIVFLFFREGSYLASIRVFGPQHTVNLTQALSLGRLLDRRLQAVCALG